MFIVFSFLPSAGKRIGGKEKSVKSILSYQNAPDCILRAWVVNYTTNEKER